MRALVTCGPPTTVVHVPANPHPGGRDFVVGDIHGQHQALVEELLVLDFDPRKDRLFSTGDLIDRGPDSLDVLRLIERPWFFAVLGNHETMLLSALCQRPSAYHTPRDSLRNGGDWVLRLNAQERSQLHQLLQHLSRMPLVMSVDSPDGAFLVAHAQLIDVPARAQQHKSLHELKPLTWRHEAVITWARANAYEGRRTARPSGFELVAGEPLLVSTHPWQDRQPLTYVGHTPMASALLHRSHLHIDRGAQALDRPHRRLLVLEHSAVMSKLKELLAGSDKRIRPLRCPKKGEMMNSAHDWFLNPALQQLRDLV